MYVFSLYRIENRESFQAVFWQKILPGITANCCSNNSDDRIWAFHSTYLTIDRDNPGMDLIYFVKNYYCFALLEWLTIKLHMCS